MQKGQAPILILVGIVVIIGVVAGAYYFGKSQVPKPQNQDQIISQTPQPTISAGNPAPTDTDETANWKTYTSRDGSYSFKYPEYYKLIKDDYQFSTFGFSNADEEPYSYLVISFRNITDIKSFELCSQLSKNLFVDQVHGPCIDAGSGLGQAEDILDVTLGDKKAKSFYLNGGVDNVYHIIQTVDDPKLELKMYVAGGGLDKTFNQILSTFRFD